MGGGKKRLNRKAMLFLLAGVFIGIAFFAGTSKALEVTDSADFCSSCHIMDEAHATFLQSNHATLSCNDCHIPHDNIVSKYFFKAKAGLGHMYYNTLGQDKIPDVLHATEASQEVINDNCLRCHGPTLDNIEYHDVYDGNCLSCHRSLVHGDGFYKPQEWFEPGNYDAKK